MFLSSEHGKRVLNFCYSWGASIVILGALFKLLHMPYANEILCIAMITESLVFFISAFERPSNDYHWEEVFPVLKSKNPLDRPDFEHGGGGGFIGGGLIGGDAVGSDGTAGGGKVHGGAGGGTVIIGGGVIGGGYVGGGSGEGQPAVVTGGGSPYVPPTAEERVGIGLTAMGLNISEEDSQNLANSIKKLSEAAEQISKIADLGDVTQSYIEQIAAVSQNLERFNLVATSLGEVSDSLVSSCKVISGSEGDGTDEQTTVGYVRHIEQLNEHLSGLNQFYELQLNGLRSQMDTIHNINAGLNRIRDMYDNSLIDSVAFRNENERMAQLLAQLNQIYGRMLQAMTVNMPGGGMPYAPQQSYQGGYPQQPPYNPAR